MAPTVRTYSAKADTPAVRLGLWGKGFWEYEEIQSAKKDAFREG